MGTDGVGKDGVGKDVGGDGWGLGRMGWGRMIDDLMIDSNRSGLLTAIWPQFNQSFFFQFETADVI